MQTFHAYQSDQSGAVVIEAVFAFPFIVALGFGAIDSSLLLLNNHKMEAGLSAAGNYLARAPRAQDFETQAKNLAVTGQVKAGGDAYIEGWTASDVVVSYSYIDNSGDDGQRAYRGDDQIQIIKLSSEFEFRGIGLFRGVSSGRIRLKATHEERKVG